MKKICLGNTKLSFIPFVLESFDLSDLEDLKPFMPYKSLLIYSNENNIVTFRNESSSKYIWILTEESELNELPTVPIKKEDRIFLSSLLYKLGSVKSFNLTYLVESIVIGLGDPELYQAWTECFGVYSFRGLKEYISPEHLVDRDYVPVKLERKFSTKKYSVYKLVQDLVNSRASLVVNWDSYNTITTEGTTAPIIRDPLLIDLKIVGNQSFPNLNISGSNLLTYFDDALGKPQTICCPVAINIINCGNLNTETLEIVNCSPNLRTKFKQVGILVKEDKKINSCTIDLTGLPIYSRRDRKKLDFNYLAFILEDLHILNGRIFVKKKSENKSPENKNDGKFSAIFKPNDNIKFCNYKLSIKRPGMKLKVLDTIEKFSKCNLQELEKLKEERLASLRDFIFRIYLQTDQEFEKTLYSYIGNELKLFRIKYEKV